MHAAEGQLLVVAGRGRARGRPLGLAPLYLRDEGLKDPRRCLRTVAVPGHRRARARRGGRRIHQLAGGARGHAAGDRGGGGRAGRTGATLGSPAAGTGVGPSRASSTSWAAPCAGRPCTSSAAWWPPSARRCSRWRRYLAALPSAQLSPPLPAGAEGGPGAGVEFVRAGGRGAGRARCSGRCIELHQQRWEERGKPGVFASDVFTGSRTSCWIATSRPATAPARTCLAGGRCARADRWLAVRYLLRAGDRLYDYISGVDTGTARRPGPRPAAAPSHHRRLRRRGHRRLRPDGRRLRLQAQAGAARKTALPTLDLFARTVRSRLWLTARDLGRQIKATRRAPASSRICRQVPPRQRSQLSPNLEVALEAQRLQAIAARRGPVGRAAGRPAFAAGC